MPALSSLTKISRYTVKGHFQIDECDINELFVHAFVTQPLLILFCPFYMRVIWDHVLTFRKSGEMRNTRGQE